jgi:hypothetical protein
MLAAMERARATWTDERLDDLARGIEGGFRRLDEDVRELRTDITGLRTEMNTRFDAQHRLAVQIGALTIGTVVAALVTGLLAG